MRHAISLRALIILFTASLASLGVTGLAQDGVTGLPPTACASLLGLSIPASAIDLETSGALVQTAVPMATSDPGNVNGDFCKVTGIVMPRNATHEHGVRGHLPLAWNRRVLQMGGGGYNGTLVRAAVSPATGAGTTAKQAS